VTVAVVVLAVLAGLLAIATLVMATRARRFERELAGATGELADAHATIDARDAALDVAQESEAAAGRRADDAETAVAAMETERRALDARASEVVAERDRLAADVARLTDDNNGLTEIVLALQEQAASLEERAGRFREDHRPGLDATALWNLELARAERTWRHSVAVSPDQDSPFAGTDDALGVAVEVEVAALREEVGVAMELRWDVTVDDLARRLLVLRLVQELLSVASRAEQAVVLSAESGEDGAVVLHLDSPDENEGIGVVRLEGVEHLITVETDDGVRVTVH
jgi:hypothetical protein